MKKIFFLLAAALFGFNTMAQGPGSLSFSTDLNYLQGLVRDAGFYSGLSFSTNKKVVGTPFLMEEYYTGYIRFFNDTIIRNLSLKYNQLYNELYYQDARGELVLTTAFKEFGINAVTGGSNKAYVFKNGYPALSDTDAKTFYQFLGGQQVAFLKRNTKELREAVAIDGSMYYRIIDREEYYVYNTAKRQLTQIKKDKESIIEALPDFKNKIETVCAERKIKCKNENEITLLFSQL
jgi:hypothetical protein